MKLIEVNNLVFSYDKKNTVVDGVSFSVEAGKYISIIGHNGSGKSTIARLLLGLLESKEGAITAFGKSLNNKNIHDIRSKIGIVFQNPDNQFIGATVADDIAFGLENRCVPTKDMEKLIHEFAWKVHMQDFLNKEPENLSGGQKQRVAIAGVLAMQPELIIFDEATSMLDPKGKREILELIRKMREKMPDLTIISITHDIEEVLQSDDCIVLNQGKLFMHDKPEKVFAKADQLKKIDLDVPFTYQVKEAFDKYKVKLKSDDLKGLVDELCQYHSSH